MNLAHKFGRKVALTGRSLQQNIELARDLGYLRVPKGLLVDIGSNIAGKDLVVLSTGSQGELRSALNRMALGTHRQIQIHSGDTIIVSGGTIPGNEEDVARMINNLFARGANVIYGSLDTVHVSGHGSREDMRAMLKKVSPRYLIPVHGETRHLHLHSRLAQETNVASENVFILDNGSVWASDGDKAWLEEAVPAGDVYVDGSLIGEIGEQVMRDRERLSQDGFVVVYVPIDKKMKLAGEPRIISRGFLHMSSSEALLNAARAKLKQDLKRNGRIKEQDYHQTVRETLQDFFYLKTQSRPVILSNIVRI